MTYPRTYLLVFYGLWEYVIDQNYVRCVISWRHNKDDTGPGGASAIYVSFMNIYSLCGYSFPVIKLPQGRQF